MINNYK